MKSRIVSPDDLKKEIEKFFTERRSKIEVEAFISEIMARSKTIQSLSLKLNPSTIQEYRELKVECMRLDNFFDVINLLQEKTGQKIGLNEPS